METQDFVARRTREQEQAAASAREDARFRWLADRLEKALEKALAPSLSPEKVRVVNIPHEQAVTGTVQVRDVPVLSQLLSAILSELRAIEIPQAPDVQRVEILNHQTFPEFPRVEIPEFPDEISATLKELPALTQSLKAIEDAVRAVEASPTVLVDAPDLLPVSEAVAGLHGRLEGLAEIMRAAVTSGQMRDGRTAKTLTEKLDEVKQAVYGIPVPQYPRFPLGSDGTSLRVMLYATDIASGKPYPVSGLFDPVTGGFEIMTSGTGSATTPPTPVNMVGPWLSLGLTNIQHS